MHDPRVGRFFARDPLFKEYPFYSPYAFSGNRVIDKVELEGLEPADYDFGQDPLAGVRVIKTVAQDLEIASYNAVTWLHAYANPFNSNTGTRSIKEKVVREDGFTDVGSRTVKTGLKDRVIGSLDVIGAGLTLYGGPSSVGLMVKSESSSSISNTSKQVIETFILKINGRFPRNFSFAGKLMKFEEGTILAKKYSIGVKFKETGFPNFSPFSKKTVDIGQLNKNIAKDFQQANKAAGYSETPANYTWHHVENSTKLELVPSDLHSAVPHTGGRATNAPKN
ncbi:HNH endonuclease [Flavobacterium gawalongense]|nr:HNH endonuclease [Flavobacterium gawalongense]TRX09649.1 HNH endonuclease [Flavobacterium gawalongense]TRX10875.1 HNH endonuclease [Flavobacterium gawalongense]TRX28054.1 HNH endonuclease [Flavobacterium gawalongense]